MQIFFSFLLKQFLQIHTTILFSVSVCQANDILLKETRRTSNSKPRHQVKQASTTKLFYSWKC